MKTSQSRLVLKCLTITGKIAGITRYQSNILWHGNSDLVSHTAIIQRNSNNTNNNSETANSDLIDSEIVKNIQFQ